MIYIAIVAFFVLLALWFFKDYKSRSNPIDIKNPQKAEGKVVDITEVRGFAIRLLDVKTTYYPVIRFLVPGGGGKAVRFQGRIGTDKPDTFSMGQSITVEYEKENPLRARMVKKIE